MAEDASGARKPSRMFVAEVHAGGTAAPRAHPNSAPRSAEAIDKLLTSVHRGSIGESKPLVTPMGLRRITYADHTASGRSLSFVEEFMTRQVAVTYANTHTSSSQTGYQTTMFRHEAREMVKRAVGATDRDAALFLGNGATGAAHSLVHLLGIRHLASVATAEHAAERGEATEELEDGTMVAADKKPVAFVTPGCMTGSFAPMRAAGMKTGAVHFKDEAQHSLAMKQAHGGRELHGLAARRPLVLVGPYAHHSSLLPWREAGADVIILPEAQSPHPPGVNLCMLEKLLVQGKEEGRPLIVGVMAAASNITGILVDTDTPTALLHAHGALSVWDYAAAAPHAPVVVNPSTGSAIDAGTVGTGTALDACVERAAQCGVSIPGSPSLDKDAIFFSVHKFPGGPGTPGVLVVKKHLLQNAVPAVPGGGTVFFVKHDGHPRYLANIEEREEGGTPNIPGAIRAGLVMRLHSAVGPSFIRSREAATVAFASERWRRHPSVVLLGREDAPRAAIFSLMFPCRPRGYDGSDVDPSYLFSPRHNDVGGRGYPLPGGVPLKGSLFHDGESSQGSVNLYAPGRKFLHWGFVAAVLADLFGIQCRGGCLCAGPYALRLLGMTPEHAEALEDRLLDLEELLRPGVVRVSMPYHMPHHVVRMIVAAIEFVGTFGVDLLSLYAPRADTGEWRYSLWRHVDRPRKWLHMVSFESGEMEVQDGFHDEVLALPGDAAVHAGHRDQESSASLSRTVPQPSKQIVQQAAAVQEECAAWLSEPVPGLDHAVSNEASRRMASTVAVRAAAVLDAAAASGHDALLAPRTAEDEAEIADFAKYFQEAMCEVLRAQQALKARRVTGLVAEELEEALLSEPAKPLRWFALAGEVVEPPAVSEPEASAVAAALATATAVGDDSDESDDEGGPLAGLSGDILADDRTREDQERLDRINQEAAEEAMRITGRTTVPVLTGKLSGFAPTHAHFFTPPSRVLAKVKFAVLKHRMIWPGDRVCLGLSGGKDSLSCLHILVALRHALPFTFDIHCCTIDPQSPGFDPTPLIWYCKGLGIPYHLESDDIIGLAGKHMDEKKGSICSFCSRMKRGMLYKACRREKCNVLVLAQHMDDLCESLVMSMFHNGLLRTMKAHYANDVGDIRVIRPLVYVRERSLRDFADVSKLPVIEDNCPACFAAPTERYRTKQLLRSQEQLYPSIIENISRSLDPLLRDRSWPQLKAEGTKRLREVMDLRLDSSVERSKSRAAKLAAEEEREALEDDGDDDFAADGGMQGADGDDFEGDDDPAASKIRFVYRPPQ
jgi:selenocysteine lyase/cysteine desulfurase/tRNA(Ile)-lysidine synthase TilS/MesJ